MAVQVAIEAIRDTPGFRTLAWKTVADAIFCLSKQSSFFDTENIYAVLMDVLSLLPAETSGRLSGILTLPQLVNGAPVGGRQALEVVIVIYDHRISAEDVATGSSWYDLGIALHFWSTKTVSKENRERAEKEAAACLTKALRENPGNDTVLKRTRQRKFCGATENSPTCLYQSFRH